MSDGTRPKNETPTEIPKDGEKRVDAVLRLLPVQDAPNTGKNPLVVKRGPGRPRKVERMPTTSDLTYHAEMAKERENFIASDALVQSIENHSDALSILHIIKKEVACEAASLHFERIETEKRGRDTSQTSSRRIEALKKIADIELKIKELDTESLDLSSEKMQKIFSLWVNTMREIAQETLPPEALDMFFNRFATAMDGWEERASNTLR